MSEKTPLQRACEDLDVPLVSDLLSSGADPNQKYPNGKTLLHQLATRMVDAWTQDSSDLMTVIELLLEHDADPNARDANGYTPFHAAVETGYTKGVYVFMRYDVDLDARDDNGDTALNVACRVPELKIVWLLVDEGADVNTASKDGSTPVHWAARNCYKQVLKYLLAHGARVNALDAFGCTPLMWVLKPAGFVVRANSKAETLRYLLKNGADPNIVDMEGKNILSIGLDKEEDDSISSSEDEFEDEEEDKDEDCNKVLLEHLARMEAFNVQVNPSLLDTISKNSEMREYFEICRTELTMAKKTQIHPDHPVTFLDLLTSDVNKLINYVANTELIDRINVIFGDTQFYIYGDLICKNLGKGMKRRVLFEEAVKKLKKCLPIVDLPDKIVEKILSYFDKTDLMTLYYRD